MMACAPWAHQPSASSSTGFNPLGLTCLIGAVTTFQVMCKSELLHRFEVLLPGPVGEQSPGTGQHHPWVLPVACLALQLVCDGDNGTGALLLRWACGRAIAESLCGVCHRCPPGPCVAAAHTVPLQIPKCWLPRYIRRSRIQRPRHPLSLRFNGKLRLKGLKSGIKAAVARLLAAGEAHEWGGWGAGDAAPSLAVLPGRTLAVCVCTCVWVSL